MMVALWVAGPAAVFLVSALYVALIGLRTKDLQLHAPTPAAGRRGMLVNVSSAADRTSPVGPGPVRTGA